MADGGGLSRRDVLQAGVVVAVATTGVLASPLRGRGQAEVAAAAGRPRRSPTTSPAHPLPTHHVQRHSSDRQVLHRRPPHVWSRPAYHVDDLVPHARHRAIALTIDDGPDPEWTPRVLRILRHYGVVANFCLVGIHVRQYPHLARAIVRLGH